MESLAFLFLIISGVHAWGDMQCSGADVCEDPTVLDLTEDELAISLLQRRAFLERPQVDVEDGMLVAVHSVSAMRDMKTEELEHKHEAAESSAEFSATSSSTVEKALSPVPAATAATQETPAAETARAATVAAPADRRLSLVETRSDPTLDVVKSAIAGIQHNKSNIAGGVQMAASSNASSVNDTDDNSTIKLNLNLGGAPHNVEEKLQEAENVSRVEMKTLATLIVEAIILFIAETCRRIWFMGAVEASTDARLAVLSFPFIFWVLHWSCGSSKRGSLPEGIASGLNAAAASSAEDDRQLSKPQVAEMKEPARCVFESVGCALERTGHQGCGETVAFRYLALNASGLAYAALGRPRQTGRWRIEMLETFWPSSKDGDAEAVDLMPLLDSILLGIVHEQDVNTASDELGGHWAFVSADRGRGFAYSPAGRAVRRGVETPCAAVADPRSDVIELVLDTPRRAFEVFCLRESSRELICSFEGIRPGRYLLAVSLRTGSIKVEEMSETTTKGIDEST
jgi:hypothetical protein